MANEITQVSRLELNQRRQRLKRQRQTRFLRSLWRTVAVFGLAGGLFWLATRPTWLIRKPEQIMIEGNRYIPTPAIRSLLPIDYPQSLLKVEPQRIVQQLKAKAPIAEVKVTRQLFPPGLSIQVKERYLVAIALTSRADQQFLTSNNKNAAKKTNIGLLDASGMWIPLERYGALDKSIKLPELKVIGQPQRYRSFWPKLYNEIHRSPIKIFEIDCQDPTNLILRTELGVVHLGAYGYQFPQQIKTLARLQKLPSQVSLNQISYIDLKSPDAPSVQLVGTKEPVKPNVRQ